MKYNKMKMEEIIVNLTNSHINFKNNIYLSNYTYMRTGGVAQIIIYPENAKEVSKTISILNELNISFKVIGATSNLLFKDQTDYTCLLSTTEIKGIEYHSDERQIVVGSGIMLPDLSRFALYQSIKGFEGLEGIPGTVGGAVFMNAGAYGYDIKKIISKVEIVDFDSNTKIYLKNDLLLQNRNSALREGKIKGVITKCWFDATIGDVHNIEKKMEVFHSKRHKYLDYLYPNLGSVFSGSIYRELGKSDKYFFLLSTLFYLFNYKFKIFRRESPVNRKWINDIAVKRFGLRYNLQPFSDKTINSLVNRGQGTEEMIAYINDIQKLTKNKVPLENEIVEGF